MSDAASKRVPPYLPFKTFLNSFDVLSQGVPPQIDRTLWRTQSGGDQGLIMNAYRFFGFVDDDDMATSYLESVAHHPDKRPAVLRELVQNQYDEVIDLDTTKMTLKMLDSAFEDFYAVSGATKQKAITFFLKAAKFADIPLSPYLLTQLRNTGPRKKRTSKVKVAPVYAAEINQVGNASIQPVLPNPASGIETHSVRLVSGGTVTLSVSAKWFALPKQDRDFVIGLIDKVQEYEKAHPLAVPTEEDEEEND